jgi:glycosyltransferase involved in cell wall biosynthesis
MAALVTAVRPRSCFVMVGEGPLAAEAEAEARRLGVDIRFLGFRTDAPLVASAFDVFVISSLYEGLGRALTEAVASGRPVVATAVNGVPDLIVPGATGLLATPGDPTALARCVLWTLDHPAEARRLGEAGSRWVRWMFDPARMCDLIDQTYCRLLGLPGPNAASPPPAAPRTHRSPSTRQVVRDGLGNGSQPTTATSTFETEG